MWDNRTRRGVSKALNRAISSAPSFPTCGGEAGSHSFHLSYLFGRGPGIVEALGEGGCGVVGHGLRLLLLGGTSGNAALVGTPLIRGATVGSAGGGRFGSRNGAGTSLDIAVVGLVETARSGPLTVGHGDSEDPRFRASAGAFAR